MCTKLQCASTGETFEARTERGFRVEEESPWWARLIDNQTKRGNMGWRWMDGKVTRAENRM